MAVAQEGDPYDVGHGEPAAGETNPSTLDCSELVQWASRQAGVDVADGSWLQYFQLDDSGSTMSVEEALHTPGALLFSFDPPVTRGGGRPAHAHVAISLGDGRTIEAMSATRGIAIARPDASRWTNAGFIPEFRGQESGVNMDAVLQWRGQDDNIAKLLDLPVEVGADSSVSDPAHDSPTDSVAASQIVADIDADDDGFADRYETLVAHTDPHAADTDGDRTLDSIERFFGRDPLTADSASAPVLLDWIDTDGDALSDREELELGFNPAVVDSDGDGVTDFEEARQLWETPLGTSGDTTTPDFIAPDPAGDD